MTVETVARVFHDEYEHLAPLYGWETQKASRVEWDDLPENQRKLMVHVIEALRQALRDGRVTPADLGMVPAAPFGADGHGMGCAYRRGHDCNCTARTARYWAVPK